MEGNSDAAEGTPAVVGKREKGGGGAVCVWGERECVCVRGRDKGLSAPCCAQPRGGGQKRERGVVGGGGEEEMLMGQQDSGMRESACKTCTSEKPNVDLCEERG